MILVEELESHKSSHSSEVIDGFLFLGGERNAKNKKVYILLYYVTFNFN